MQEHSEHTFKCQLCTQILAIKACLLMKNVFFYNQLAVRALRNRRMKEENVHYERLNEFSQDLQAQTNKIINKKLGQKMQQEYIYIYLYSIKMLH